MSVPNADVTARSIDHQPSETALATATLRALAALDERAEIGGADILAELFLPDERRALLHDPHKRRGLLAAQVTPGAYEYMLARTAFFDGLVQEALEHGIPQVAFLGAGYDTRPYRFAALAGSARLFELDALPTQRHKRAVLSQAGVPLPEHLTFVPIDFRKGGLADALRGAGFSPARPALFIWEGVSYYLPPEAVDATLAAVRALAAPGSRLGFDCALLSAEVLEEERGRRLRGHMKTNHPAEPARFGIPREQLDSFLAARGYKVRERLGAIQIEARYLTLTDGTLVGHVPALFALVLAEPTFA